MSNENTEAPGVDVDVDADVDVELYTPSPDELDLILPEDPDEAVDLLLRELGASRAAEAEAQDQYLRALAELDNVRKRSLRDRTMFIEQSTERVMARLLPVLDTFEAGIAGAVETESEQRLQAGLQGTFTQLMDALAAEGLAPIDALGEPFDPTLHEAVSVLGEGDHLVVHHQMRRGFRLKDRVLRPATVVVGPPPEAQESE